MYRIQCSIFIAAPPSKVWSVLIDVNSWSTWNSYVIKARTLLPHHELAVGSQQVISVAARSPSIAPAEYENETLVFEPERELRWGGKILHAVVLDTEHWCLLEPTMSDGVEGTSFTQGERFSGLLVPMISRLGKFQEMEEGYVRMNQDLKKIIEDGPVQSGEQQENSLQR